MLCYQPAFQLVAPFPGPRRRKSYTKPAPSRTVAHVMVALPYGRSGRQFPPVQVSLYTWPPKGKSSISTLQLQPDVLLHAPAAVVHSSSAGFEVSRVRIRALLYAGSLSRVINTKSSDLPSSFAISTEKATVSPVLHTTTHYALSCSSGRFRGCTICRGCVASRPNL